MFVDMDGTNRFLEIKLYRKLPIYLYVKFPERDRIKRHITCLRQRENVQKTNVTLLEDVAFPEDDREARVGDFTFVIVWVSDDLDTLNIW